MREQDFLNQIEAHPDDDLPKLVYADWLDEQGDPLGAVIRLSCELRKKLPECKNRARLGCLGISVLLIDPGSRVGLFSFEIGGRLGEATVSNSLSIEQETFEGGTMCGRPVRQRTGRRTLTLELGLN